MNDNKCSSLSIGVVRIVSVTSACNSGATFPAAKSSSVLSRNIRRMAWLSGSIDECRAMIGKLTGWSLAVNVNMHKSGIIKINSTIKSSR